MKVFKKMSTLIFEPMVSSVVSVYEDLSEVEMFEVC